MKNSADHVLFSYYAGEILCRKQPARNTTDSNSHEDMGHGDTPTSRKREAFFGHVGTHMQCLLFPLRPPIGIAFPYVSQQDKSLVSA